LACIDSLSIAAAIVLPTEIRPRGEPEQVAQGLLAASTGRGLMD
jgi:hypothetical protein